MSIFEAFETPKPLREQYETHPCIEGVMGLKTLNVICGPNNSGKSRLLRALVESSVISEHALISKYWPDGQGSINAARRASANIWKRITGGRICRDLWKSGSGQEFTSQHYDALLEVLLGDINKFESNTLDVLRQHSLDPMSERQALVAASWAGGQRSIVYVPAIRSCRRLGQSDSIYKHVNERYFRKSLSMDKLYCGEELYQRVRDHLLGPPHMRQRVRDFEKLLSEQFFDDRAVSLSPREEHGNGELHIRIEPEHERAVSELGDGMQSIIIQLAPAFLSKGDWLVLFIEEPELYLHPGLQRRLFEVLLDLDKLTDWERHQVFVTSHSNHLLDLTLDHDRIAILRVEKTVGDRSDNEVLRATAEEDAKFKVEMVAPGEIRLLHDLGVQSSSVFLSNCTIWVEGPTDRTVIRHYMELIAEDQGVELREDLDFSFVYYAGSLAERLSLLDDKAPDIERMCSKLFFVADRDIKTKGDRAARLEAKLGERFHLLGCREIENSVTASVLRKIVAARTKSNPDELPLVKEAGLADAKLGNLLSKTYEDTTAKRAWAAKDGGLSQDYKSDFAELVCTCVASVEEMAPAAIAVAEAAVEFVHNHRAAANTPAG